MTKSEMRAYAKKHNMTLSEVRKMVRSGEITRRKKVYHYTHGLCMGSILKDGFIAREGERGTYRTSMFDSIWDDVDSLVWLTKSSNMPLGAFPDLLGKNGEAINCRLLAKDLNFASQVAEGLFRFVFYSSNPNIKRYKRHRVRNQMHNANPELLRSFEKVTKKEADDFLRDWFVSNERLPIEDVEIEKWVDGEWVAWKDDIQESSAFAA
jgi:hypothetical protein